MIELTDLSANFILKITAGVNLLSLLFPGGNADKIHRIIRLFFSKEGRRKSDDKRTPSRTPSPNKYVVPPSPPAVAAAAVAPSPAVKKNSIKKKSQAKMEATPFVSLPQNWQRN